MLFFTLLQVWSEVASVTQGVVVNASQVEILMPPKDKCFGRIVQLIDGAKETIYMQAYQLTSQPIAEALKRAQTRGVKVYILADKTQTCQTGSTCVPALARFGIPVKIDYTPAIAHNKIIVIDGKTTLTGSYNWTDGAEKRNAENLLILENQPQVATVYRKNWDDRSAVSKSFDDYISERKK